MKFEARIRNSVFIFGVDIVVAIMSSARAHSPCSAYSVISTRNPPPVAIRSRRSEQQCCTRVISSSTLGSSLRGPLVRANRIVLSHKRLRGFELYIARAGIKEKSEEPVGELEVRLNDDKRPLSQLTVSLPLGLASFEGLFLVGWIASLRGLIPGSLSYFGVADLVLSGIMIANCVGGWYALERSQSEVDALNPSRKLKAAAPGWLDMVFSLAVNFIPFANLFLWLRFASKQKNLPGEARAALVANALIYEVPRLLALLFLFSGGLSVFLQIGVVSSLAFLLSAVHRPLAEARVKNEIVLMEVVRAEKIKAQAQKPKEVVSLEEKERIARLKELEEFDMLLAQSSSSPGTEVLPAKPKDWSVGETMEWLGQQGLARYAATFADNNIDGELLLQLSNNDLRDELQILSFGDRRKLELLIQQLKDR